MGFIKYFFSNKMNWVSLVFIIISVWFAIIKPCREGYFEYQYLFFFLPFIGWLVIYLIFYISNKEEEKF